MKLPKKHRFKFLVVGILLAFSLFTAYSILHTDLDVSADCLESTLNEGLISAGGTVTGKTGNVNKICVTGTQDASYREFKVPSYQDLENQFYTLSRVPGNIRKAPDSLPRGTGSAPAGWNGLAGDGIYKQTTTVYLSSVAGTGTQVIFIQGNLNITGNITYACTNPPLCTSDDPNSGLVFIVSGNINIAPAVTKINAVLISSGLICTATSDFSNSTCYNGIDLQQLVINGSLISINTTNLTEPAIRLGRSLVVNDEPAEIVNKQPKYLYNLRKGLFTKDLIITSEDQLYPITTAGAPSPSPSSAPPPGPVICNPLPNSISGDDVKIAGCICLSGTATCPVP